MASDSTVSAPVIASRRRRRNAPPRSAVDEPAVARELAAREDGAAFFRFMRRTKDAAQPNHVIEAAPRAAVVSKPPGYLLIATCERRRPWFACSRERLYCTELSASLRKGLRHVASRDRTCARGADGCFSSPGAFSGVLRRNGALSPWPA